MLNLVINYYDNELQIYNSNDFHKTPMRVIVFKQIQYSFFSVTILHPGKFWLRELIGFRFGMRVVKNWKLK